jgi:hypothetical protein
MCQQVSSSTNAGSDGSDGRARWFLGILRADVIVDQFTERGGEFVVVAVQGDKFLAVDVDGAAGLFAGAGQADADVGGFRFAGAVDDAAHHGERHLLDALVLLLPLRHAVADVALDALGQLLERRAGGASAAGAGRHAGRERAQSERLEQLARGVNFFAAVAAGPRRQRDANRVANTFLQQDADGRGGPYGALGAHARFGEAQVQRLLGLAGEVAVDLNEILRLGNLARNNDLVAAQSALERQPGRFDRGKHHAIVDDLFGVEAQVAVGVFLHLAHDQLLIERAAIDADAHGLAVVDRDFADRRELFVAARARAHVPRIDAVLVERPRAVGILGQQNVPVVMKITDDRRDAPGIAQPRYDFGYRGGRFRHVHRDPHQLRAGVGQLLALRHGSGDVRRIRVGHRLHDHRRAAAHLNVADLDANRFAPRYGKYLHVFLGVPLFKLMITGLRREPKLPKIGVVGHL